MTLRPLDVNTVTVLHLAIKVPSGQELSALTPGNALRLFFLGSGRVASAWGDV